QISARRVANSRRPESAASSGSHFLRSAVRSSAALTAMHDLDYGTCAEPHDLWRRILQADAYRETLRYAYPVERTFHIGERAGKIDAVLIQYSPTNTLHDPADRQLTVNHRVNPDAIALRHGSQIRL